MLLSVDIKNTYCEGCEVYKQCWKSNDYDCITRQTIQRVKELEQLTENIPTQNTEGCFICQRNNDIFFDDGRGGLRIAEYCPNCGKKVGNS